ncbi:MAG: hypothetical protein JSV10_04055 [Candidatus Zixiibacteriota bacterium]|nr:MAG: hypothetical protein JSV10_04055 [candidate division Zixibacteria bacterium]
MKKLSLFIAGLMLLSLLICSFATGATEVKVGKGDLRIGGILQAGYTYNAEDEKGNDSFWLKRARFLFWGTIVPDKVKYFVQLDHRGSISVLDYKMQLFYIEKTQIAIGRFLPNFTLYMPYSTAKLEMINYPFTTTKYAVWRQCGIQSTTKTEYVDFNLGIFNGGDVPNNWGDNNDAKDFLVRADVKPPIEEATVRFGGYAWVGFAPDPNDNEETLKRNRFGGFVKADYTKDDVTVRVRGEFLAAEDEYAYSTKDSDGTETDNSQAFFGHVGVQPVPQVEFMVRYDSHDPCTDKDDDGTSAVTGGVNYYIDAINAMFYLNYIHNMAQWEDFEDYGVVQAQAQITF